MRVELILLGLGVLAVGWLRKQSEQNRQGRSDDARGTWRAGRRGSGGHSQSENSEDAHDDSVRFRDGASAGDPDADTRDAFTGERLRNGSRLFQCTDCKSYYHEESVDLLRRENSGKCVSCGKRAIVRDTIAEQAIKEAHHSDPEAKP